MFDALLGLDFMLAMSLPVVWLLAGWGVGRLRHRRTPRSLRDGAIIALVSIGVAGLFALSAAALAAAYWGITGWWIAKDRVLVTLPVVLLPAVAALLVSVPGLARLRRRAAGEVAGEAVSRELAAAAASPAIVVPAQTAAVGSLAGVWYTLFDRPVDGNLTTAATVAAIVGVAAAAGLWARQRARVAATRAPGGRPGPGVQPAGRGTRIVRGAIALTIVVAGSVGAYSSAAASSRLPERLAMGAGGVVDLGGGPPLDHAHGAGGGVPVTELRERDLDGPVRRFTLTTRKATVRLSSGAAVDAWTFNGTIPGPELRVRHGDLVEVTLVNADIDAGVTIHWHGVDLPNAADGVAGVTQDAVPPGGRYSYRFKADQVGTFWYHSHQQSSEQVAKGLFGALVIEPKQARAAAAEDLAVVIHDWQTRDPRDRGGQPRAGGDPDGGGDGAAGGDGDGAADTADAADGGDGGGPDRPGRTVTAYNDADTLQRRQVEPGTPVRLRVVNADSDTRSVTLAGTGFKVAAIDGTDLHRPGDLTDRTLVMAGGGRYDLTFTMPARPVLLASPRDGEGWGGGPGLLLSPDGGGEPPAAAGGPVFDPLDYGEPAATPFGPSSRFDRSFSVTLDTGFGFYDGQPVGTWKINGRVFPDTPMQMVREGDLVKVTFVNRSFADHPMHLHGHHMLVLSRDGRPSSGSPWWTDTLRVAPGERFEVAFRADNLGIWMDHCHNLEHAAVGMTMHLAYEGVSSPFEVGHATGNHPE